jgi:hypothetical protein
MFSFLYYFKTKRYCFVGLSAIVLVHGNGNEPVGIEKFFELIGRRQTETQACKWMLFDLRESIADEEKGR